MGAYDAFQKASVGGTSFQLDDYSVKDSAITRAGYGEIGRQIVVDGTGWVEAASPSAFVAALADVRSKFRVQGQDFRVYGLSELEEFSILAAQCAEGGPTIDFEQLSQMGLSPLRKRFSFLVRAQTVSSSSGGGGGVITVDPEKGYQQTTAKGPDGLRVVTRTGEFIAANAAETFLGTFVPNFTSIYPMPQWVIDRREFEHDSSQKSARYTLSARELRSPLPGGEATVNGEASLSRDIDDQGRMITNRSADLVLSTVDFQPVLDVIRASALAGGGKISRERMIVTFHKECRLTTSFDILSSAEGNGIVNWQQTIRYRPPDEVWAPMTYPGVKPALVLQPEQFGVLFQSGRVIGIGKQLLPPDPLFPETLAAERDISSSSVSATEIQTDWNYQMWVEKFDFDKIASLLQTPAALRVGS